MAEQLFINPKELNEYAQRENTRLEHLQEIRDIYGYSNFLEQDGEQLFNTLLPIAMENCVDYVEKSQDIPMFKKAI